MYKEFVMGSSLFGSKPSSWFKTKVLSLLGLFLLSFFLVGCGSGGGGKSSSNNMTGFTFNTSVIIPATIFSGINNNSVVDITIDENSGNKKTPIVTHQGKSYSPTGEIDFSKVTIPIPYIITAENGFTKQYYVIIRRAFIVSNESQLTTAIDRINSYIGSPDNKSANYFTILITKDINLTKTEQRNITDSWKGRNIILEKYNSENNVTIKGLTIEADNIVTLKGVNAKIALQITDFTFGGGVIKNATIDNDSIDITIDYDSIYTTPEVNHTGVDYSPKGKAINFADIPANYIVTAASNLTKSYSVIVRRAFVVSGETELASAIDTITDDNLSYITILINNDINLTGANNRTIPDSWKDRNITIEKNSTTTITIGGLTVEGNDTVGVIDINIVNDDNANSTIGGNSTNNGTNNGTNNSTNNGTNPKTDKDLTGFSFANGVIKNATISGANVDITIDYNLSSPTPIVTHTGFDYFPKEAINLTTTAIPKTYTITAEDGFTKDYLVTLRRAIIVSNENQLASAIDTINANIANNKYITILITNDISLTGANNRTVPSTWAGKNIILEKYNSNSQDVIIRGLESNGIVGLIEVKLEKVITAVAAGGSHSLTIDNNGKLWATGYNWYGQLGLGNSGSGTNRNSLQGVMISGLASNAKIASISGGGYHSLALDSEGKLWGSGDNSLGELGLGNNNIISLFQPITISGLAQNANIVSVATGSAHSLALDSSGKLWATGSSGSGQLGLGNTNLQTLFQPVTISGLASGANITSVSAGSAHSLALDSSGKLWATGYNFYGQLGLGNSGSEANRNSFQSVTISGLASAANITYIAAGNGHSLALDSDGKLWATGHNAYGQLGLGNNVSQNSFQIVTISGLTSGAKIISVAAGNGHSLALDSDGKVWATGRNAEGQLGLGNSGSGMDKNLFQLVTIYGLTSGTKIISIAVGDHHSFAIDSNGKLWATGYNSAGSLGLGDINNRNSFIPVSF
jgi:hypothetical protein